MARTRRKLVNGSATHTAVTSVTSSPEAFRNSARRLSRAAREIEIVNSISGCQLFLRELEVGRAEAIMANRTATNIGSMTPRAARDELRRLEWMAATIEDHAWHGTVLYAHSIGEIDIYTLQYRQRQGLFMELVMLRSVSKPVPQRLIDKYMTNADRAERFMKLLAA